MRQFARASYRLDHAEDVIPITGGNRPIILVFRYALPTNPRKDNDACPENKQRRAFVHRSV
jgi:hypothetical protein